MTLMISFPDTLLSMSTSLIFEEQPITSTVGALPYWDLSIDASKSVRELLDLLDKNPQIPGVLIIDEHEMISLMPREKVYEKLGRPFGIELFLKISCRQFYGVLEISTLVLDSETLLDDAVKKALLRQEQTLYEPIVVAHPNGYRVITMYSLIMAQQDKLQDLYSEVRYLSTKDPLTMVNNRRGFFETVNHRLVTTRHFDLEYTVLMIDMDNFKSVNDRYGHMVGDEIIKSVAQKIHSKIREKDVLGRFGGEEFVVFLMDITQESAFSLAEKLRRDIASEFHIINGLQIRVTISIGISHSKGANYPFDRLLAEADEAVYSAKDLGRNKAIIWKENLEPQPKGRKLFSSTKNNRTNQPGNIADQTLQGLLHMLYLRDYETEAHTLRVSKLTRELASKVGVPDDELAGIHIGALLHDVGKIAIPDNILFKQGKLSTAEWEIMQKHPQYAYDLISPFSYFQHALDIPYCHHEHWDGSGYPRGLKQENIPLFARIFTIVDVWDALSSDRPYRAAMNQSDIKDYILSQTGLLFDPGLVPVFLEIVDNPLP
jgi:diguanylate cyclase (GGDEF)-like protein